MKFSEIYKNGTEICEVMWSKSFKYETDESKAFSLTFPYGQPNPNNRVPAPAPRLCPFRPPFNSTAACAADVTALPSVRGPPSSHGHPTYGLPDGCPHTSPLTASFFRVLLRR